MGSWRRYYSSYWCNQALAAPSQYRQSLPKAALSVAIAFVISSASFLRFAGIHSLRLHQFSACLLVNYYNFILQFEQNFWWFDSFHAGIISISIFTVAALTLEIFRLKGSWSLLQQFCSVGWLFAFRSHCFSKCLIVGHNSFARSDFQRRSTFSCFLDLNPLLNF